MREERERAREIRTGILVVCIVTWVYDYYRRLKIAICKEDNKSQYRVKTSLTHGSKRDSTSYGEVEIIEVRKEIIEEFRRCTTYGSVRLEGFTHYSIKMENKFAK